MTKYFIEGGPLFMGLLTIVLLVIFAITIISLVKRDQEAKSTVNIANVKSLGLFALVLGMLGQFIGLFTAFELIGGGMDVSPQLMAQGVKVSMITSIYGMIIFVIAYLIGFLFKLMKKG